MNNAEKTLKIILDILLSSLEEGVITSEDLKDIIERRRIDLGNLPELGQALETAYLHVHDRTEASPDNKISFQNFLNSIKHLPTDVTIPSANRGEVNGIKYERSSFRMNGDAEGKHWVHSRFVKMGNEKYGYYEDRIVETDENGGNHVMQTFQIKQDAVYHDGNKLASVKSPAFLDTPTAPTPVNGTNSNQIATTAFVQNQNFATNLNLALKADKTYVDANLNLKADKTYVDANLNLKADVSSPAFTGVPTAPTSPLLMNGASSQIANLSYIIQMFDAHLVGMICDFATPNTSNFGNWIFCDGTLYSTAKYPLLFAKIGYTFGGSGSSFGIPNLKGRVTACAHASSFSSLCLVKRPGQEDVSYVDTFEARAVGFSEGRRTHSMNTTEMPSHSHLCATTNGIKGQYETGYGSTGYDYGFQAPPTTDTGGGKVHNNMQPTYYLAKYIYAK